MFHIITDGKRLPHFVLFSLLAALISICPLFAQTSKGTIAGVITDSTGAAIANSTVTAKSTQTGETRTVNTNSVGAYRVESVNPGTYTIVVTAPSFSNTTISDVRVTASVITSVNATLKPGGASETVEVQASAETLQTESGEISHTISANEVANLPIPTLNAYELATTLPGVVTTSSAMTFSNGTNFSVNGTRVEANDFLIEGQDNNDAGIRGQGLQPQNLDAIQEVSVQTNSYSPEFGNGGGSVNNLIYKSGTNNFHGALWDRLQNSSLNANDKYNVLEGYPKEKFRENTYGFDFGGPIKKNKLFFFTSYQFDHYRSSANGGTLDLPTEAGVQVLKSLMPNPRISDYLQAIGSLRGVYNISDIELGNGRPAVEVGQVQRQGIPNNTNSSEFIAKGDYVITSKDTLNLRYLRSYNESPYDLFNSPYQLPNFDVMQSGPAHNAGITYTHVFNSGLLNEARLSYGRIGFTFGLRPETAANPLANGPTISIDGLTGYGAPSGVPQGRFHNTYQYQDSLSWQHGKHSFKFGFDIADVRVRDMIGINSFGSIGYGSSAYVDEATGITTSYTGLANYIDNYGGDNTSVTVTYGNPIARPVLLSQNYFFQDAWKIRPNLTLNYGLRYEYSGTPENSLPYPAIDMANPAPATYPTRILQKADKNNFGPRLGLAYTPHFWQRFFGEEKTVLRAGFGIFYDPMFTNLTDNSASYSPNAIAPGLSSKASSTDPRGVANWSGQFAGLLPIVSPQALVISVANNLTSPQTYQWNFNLERQLPASLTLSAGYIGTRGLHLYGEDELNPYGPTGDRIYPDRYRIIAYDNTGDSIYHALNLKLERPMKHGLLLRASYTWSKNIDDVSEFATADNFSGYPTVQHAFASRGAYDRGLSAFDRRQRFAISYVYDIPKWKTSGNAFLSGISRVVNDWQISGSTSYQTGSPANVMVGYDVNQDGISNDRPNLGNAKAPVNTYAWDMGGGTLCDGATFWNSAGDTCTQVSASSVHWIVPLGAGTPGNFGRNAYTTPGYQMWDFTLGRHFKVRETQQFEFRAELFNVFNHGNTGIPNTTVITGISRGIFGDLSQTLSGNRNIRFLLKYSF